MAVIKTHPNVAAFLDTLAFSEGTATHPLTRNNGYDVIVTGIDGKPEILPIIAITRSPVGARRRSSIVAGKNPRHPGVTSSFTCSGRITKAACIAGFQPGITGQARHSADS